MNRIVLFLLGLAMSIFGLSYIIIYLNLLVMDYSFIDYLNYICGKVECIIFLVGYLLMIIAVYFKRRKKSELHI